MRKVIYALAMSCAILNSTNAMIRSHSSLENFGKKVLAETISHADSARLMQLLQNEETFTLIAQDDDLSEYTANRATALFTKLSLQDRDEMRECLKSLSAAREETTVQEEKRPSSEKNPKRAKKDDDDTSSKAAAIFEVTGALTQACLDVTAKIQKQRFEQHKADSLICAAAADAVLGNKEHPITTAVDLHTEAKQPILAKALSESINSLFAALSSAFKKDKK